MWRYLFCGDGRVGVSGLRLIISCVGLSIWRLRLTRDLRWDGYLTSVYTTTTSIEVVKTKPVIAHTHTYAATRKGISISSLHHLGNFEMLMLVTACSGYC